MPCGQQALAPFTARRSAARERIGRWRLATSCWSPTSLGRSTRELLELIERIGQAGAFFKSLGDPLFDTTTPTGRLLSTLLAAIAEFERELIRERTGEGRKRAKARGVRFGRPSVLTPHQRTEVLARLAEGDSCADIARSYNVDRSTISRLKPKPETAAA